MKYLYILIVLLAICFSGCGRKEQVDENNILENNISYIIETEAGAVELSQELIP